MKKYIYFFGIALFACGMKKENDASDWDTLFYKEFPADQPGGAVLLMKGDKVIFSKGYGLADIKTGEKVTPQTLFNTGSISKTFVSNTILSLYEDKRLDLNDSLLKFFPDFKNKNIGGRVKLHHLLTHTSGLPDSRHLVYDSIFLLTAKDEENFAPIKKCDSLLFEPGSRYEYSNPAFNGLALIIEKVTGTPWQEVVRSRVFKPSGMLYSKITNGPYPQDSVAHAYAHVNGNFVEYDYGEYPTFPAAGNGGIWSSAEELMKYELALRRTTFLKQETIDRSRTITIYPQWKDSQQPFIGYSWFIEQQDSMKIVSHTGTQGGFYADYVSIPEKQILYVILCNREIPREKLRSNVLRKLKELYWLDPK